MGKDKLPWFPFYVEAWLNSPRVSVMTPAERGAFIHLLCYAWLNERRGFLPDMSIEKLESLVGWSDVCEGKFSAVLEMFDGEPGNLSSNRMVEEAKEAVKIHKSLSQRGKDGAKKRWQGHSPAITDPSPKHSQAIAGDAQLHRQLHRQEHIQLQKKKTLVHPKTDGRWILESFDQFWEVFNYKSGKLKCLVKWKSLMSGGVEADKKVFAAKLIDAAAEYAKRRKPDFKLLPFTWLNGAHWDDDLDAKFGKPAETMAEKRARWEREEKEGKG